MAWFKVDDGFYSSRKVIRIPRAKRFAAIGLWLIAGTWCADNLTDGFIDHHELDELGGRESDASALVAVGLWQETSSGYAFHDWADYQPTREQVLKQRDAEAERKRLYRENKGMQKGRPAAVPEVSQRDNTGSPVGQIPESGHPDPTRPDPTRPVKKDTSSPRGDAAFAEFYLAYPRKQGKEAARKAFAKAVKSVDAQLVIDGARRYAGDRNLPEKRFVPHPATWLNGGRWDDEPLPSRDGATDFVVPEGQEWMAR